MKNETTMKYITCEETELLVDDYLEGMISNENRQLMEAHLKGCTSCKKIPGRNSYPYRKDKPYSCRR